MKMIVLAIIGFSLGSAGGVFLESRKPAPPVQRAADGPVVVAARDSMPSADSVAGEAPDSVSVGSTMEDSTVAHAATDVAMPAPLPVVPVPPEELEPAGPTADEILAAQASVARILGQMKPDEAAQVISNMSDDEAEAVVRQLGTRKAAMLLASLPQDRAARLARRLMVPKGSSP